MTVEFTQLALSLGGEVTERGQKMQDLHKQIVFGMQSANDHMIAVAKNLKQVRDEKLYTEAGFENFGDYTEKQLGVKNRQALNYISIVEKLNTVYLDENKGLGVTKLAMLASISEQEREIVADTISVEDSTVSELKEQIDALRAEKEAQTQQISLLTTQQDAEIKKAVATAESDKKANKDKIAKLENELKALKSKPAETKKVEVKDTKSAEELKQAKAQLIARNEEIEAKQAEIAKLRKQNATASNEDIVKFRVMFSVYKDTRRNLIAQAELLPDDKRDGAMKAIETFEGRAQ